MPASLTGFENALLIAIWVSSAVMAVMSVFLLLTLSVRRYSRDRRRLSQAKSAKMCERLIANMLAKDILPVPDMLPSLSSREVEALIAVLPDYFRNLEGGKAVLLAEIVEVWGVEKEICNKTKRQRRGLRIQALTVLSYLQTERSLKTLAQALRSDDLYVRLSGIRSLARRQAHSYLPEIIEALNSEEHHNAVMLSDILQRFGTEASWAFEYLASEAKNATVCAAALEALRLVRPEQLNLDLKSFLYDPSPAVRAGAIELIAYAGDDRISMVERALIDRSAAVRARIARALPRLGIPGSLKYLHTLLDDPVWWVRFQAHQSLEAMGPQGRAYLRAVSSSDGDNSDLAAAVLAEARSA